MVAASAGGVESLASVPTRTSRLHTLSAELPAREIDPGSACLSLGIEETDDLPLELRQLLDATGAVAPPAL